MSVPFPCAREDRYLLSSCRENVYRAVVPMECAVLRTKSQIFYADSCHICEMAVCLSAGFCFNDICSFY